MIFLAEKQGRWQVEKHGDPLLQFVSNVNQSSLMKAWLSTFCCVSRALSIFMEVSIHLCYREIKEAGDLSFRT